MGKLVQTVAYKLGVDPYRLSAELDMLLFMEQGSCVDRCSNANESQNFWALFLFNCHPCLL